jgi:hypothetical protein
MKILIDVNHDIKGNVVSTLTTFGDKIHIIGSYDDNEKCDRNKIACIASIINDVLDKSEPSDEELDYDDDAIALYDELHNTKQALEQCGYL